MADTANQQLTLPGHLVSPIDGFKGSKMSKDCKYYNDGASFNSYSTSGFYFRLVFSNELYLT